MKKRIAYVLQFMLIAFFGVQPLQAFDKDTPLSSAPITYPGVLNYGYTSWSISVGDVDGDGINDAIIGGSKVYLILGRTIGLTSGTTIEDFASASFIAENSGDGFGDAVSMTGDVNNDGYDDILISAKSYDSSRGKTYLILGKRDGWALDTPILDVAQAVFTGENQGDWSGYSIAFAGDINDDGFDDFLIGAYMADAGSKVNTGLTYLFLGSDEVWNATISLSSADVVFEGETAYEGSGQKVAFAGDVNNDGFDDMLIGAPSGQGGRGEVYLILGKASGWTGTKYLSSADASFIGEAAGDFSGNAAASAGDVNNDGFDDILIGSEENDISADRAGKVYLVFGTAAGWSMDMNLGTVAGASFLGELQNDHLGREVASAGDVNNDGFDDFLMGATWSDQFTGKAYLVFGKASGWATNVNSATADASFLGENTYDYAGFSLASMGDINLDGNSDFMIGAAYFGNTYTGKAYFLFSDAPVYGDLDADRDVDGEDAAQLSADLSQLDLEKFAAQFGCPKNT